MRIQLDADVVHLLNRIKKMSKIKNTQAIVMLALMDYIDKWEKKVS